MTNSSVYKNQFGFQSHISSWYAMLDVVTSSYYNVNDPFWNDGAQKCVCAYYSVAGASTSTNFAELFFGNAVWSIDREYHFLKIFINVYLPCHLILRPSFQTICIFMLLDGDMDKLCQWTCFWLMPSVSKCLKLIE